MSTLVLTRHHREHQIATVWHPEPSGDALEANLGRIRVLVGEPAYQLCNGEMVML